MVAKSDLWLTPYELTENEKGSQCAALFVLSYEVILSENAESTGFEIEAIATLLWS